uniref:Conserved oligomeric Golgi complex subunit 6 n=1 Tax=Salix viminalis TaxID=40686 RepID=A0A6N2K570_SALVM
MSFVDLEKPISTSSYYRVARKLRYEAAAAKFLHHQIKQIQETGTGTGTGNGDDGGIGAGTFSEAEEGAGMSDGQCGSGGFAQYSVHFLQRKHPSVTSQPQIHHRGSLSPPQSRVQVQSKYYTTNRILLYIYFPALDRVEEEVNALAECCDNIAKALSSCSASTGDIISTTERLKEELEITSQRQDVVSSFLRDYQLSNQEIDALRDEDLNDNFFKALSHVQQIHANCKVLLRTHHQRAGLELMDMMAAECRKLGDNDNPEVDELLKTAVRWLKERPALFKYCAEEQI